MPLSNCPPVTFLFTRERAVAFPFYRDVLGLKHTESNEYADCFDLAGVPLRIQITNPARIRCWGGTSPTSKLPSPPCRQRA